MFVTFFVVPSSKMARRQNPVSVFVFLLQMVVYFPGAKCSEVNQVYALPPPSMLHEHPSSSVQDVHVVKPPEILLRNSLLLKGNVSQHLQHDQPHLPINNLSSGSPAAGGPPSPTEGHVFHDSPHPSLVPIHDAHNNMPSPMPFAFDQENMSHTNHNIPFPLNPSNFPPTHVPKEQNDTSNSNFHPPNPFNTFNEVDQFVNFVPLDYENGQMPGFIPPHQKREAPRANRRAGQGPPPPRRNSTSPFKNIISSFHEKFSRMFLGPRRRTLSKPTRQSNSQQTGRNANERIFDPVGFNDAKTFELELPEAPSSANDHTFAAALNTVAQILKDNQYIPMLGKRERVRTLSPDESQHLDTLRRRDRRRRPPPRRRYPRKKRPHYRPHHEHEEDAPPRYHRDREPYHDEEEDYYSKSKYNRFPKHFNDDFGPHKDHGPPYKGFKMFKPFKPWKQNFESYEEHDSDHYRHEGKPHRGRKPAWHVGSHENLNSVQSDYYPRPHHHEKFRDYPEIQPIQLDTEGFKPMIKPYYGETNKFKNWDDKKVKFQKVIDYDSGNPFSSMKHGASVPMMQPIIKDEDARIPKIIINHHHNLPPASTGASFLPGAFPGNGVVSYTPPIHHYHGDFFGGHPRGGRGRGKKEYRSTEFADSFIVNDYGKPPMSAFSMPPPMGFPPPGPPPMQHGGPPPPPGGHMMFNNFIQNMPSHFMNDKMPPNLNHGPFVGPPAGHHQQHPVSYSNSHFPRPMIPGGHYPHQVSPGFPPMGHHPESGDAFGKPSQMASYNDMHEEFSQPTPPGFHTSHEVGQNSHERPHGPPPPDSSPFPSTNEHQDVNEFIPPFTPVPNKDELIPPTQGPVTTASRESFFNMKPRKKVPRKFQFKIVKTLSSGFEIPDKLTKHPLADPKPTPIMNYFDLGVPDREHYKKKQERKQNQNRGNNNGNRNNNPSSREDQNHRQSSLPNLNSRNQNKFESNEFNYSTLPENWNSFRPDPSHKRLPSLTHPQHDSPEIGSRMHKFSSALNPKNLVNAIMSRIPGARRVDKLSRGHTKFTPYDAKSRETTLMGASNRKRRKSTRAPASIQDIIDSDSSNHNKAIVVTLSEDNDELNNNNSAQNDHHEGGASSSSPVIVKGKGRAKRPKSRSAGEKHHISNEMQNELPFNGEVTDDVLLGMHNINVPLTAQIRMGEADEKTTKNKK